MLELGQYEWHGPCLHGAHSSEGEVDPEQMIAQLITSDVSALETKYKME